MNLDKPISERIFINEHFKFLKVAHLRELEQIHANEEITYSRMVELINELAYDFYKEKLYGGEIKEKPPI